MHRYWAHRRPWYRPPGDFTPRFQVPTGRRYPIQQAMPTSCWTSRHQEATLTLWNCRMGSNPWTQRICPSGSNQTPPPVPRQMVCSTQSSRGRVAQEPRVTESTVSAWKGMNKGIVKKNVPGQVTNSTLALPARNAQQPGAKDTARKETMKRRMEGESQIHRDGQERKKKRHESSGSSCSTSGPLLLHGCSVSLPQKPVSLKRSLVSETSDDILKKKARMYSRRSPPSKLTCGSPVPEHNSIRSSYRTTPGISQLGKKRGPTSSLFAGPASSGSQQPERPAENPREEELGHGLSTPAPAPQVIDKESPGSQQPEKTAENTSEEELDHGSSTPAPAPQVIDKESHGERAEEDSTRKEPKSSTSLLTSGSSGIRKWKRLEDPLTVPLPPLLACASPPEANRAKKARLEWFNEAREDKTDEVSNCVTKEPHLTSILPTSGTVSWPASLPTPAPDPGATPLLASLKTMQNPDCAPSLSGHADAVSTAAPAPAKPPRPSLTLPAARPASLPASLPTPAPAISTISPLGQLSKVHNLQAPPSLPVPVAVDNSVAPPPLKRTSLPAILSSSEPGLFAGKPSTASQGLAPTSCPVVPMHTSSSLSLDTVVSATLQSLLWPDLIMPKPLGSTPTKNSSPTGPGLASGGFMMKNLLVTPTKSQGTNPTQVGTLPASSNQTIPSKTNTTTLPIKTRIGLITPPTFVHIPTQPLMQTTAPLSTTSMITSPATRTITGPASLSSSKPVSGFGVNSIASPNSTTTTISTTSSATSLTSQGSLLGPSATSVAHNPVALSSVQFPQPSALSTSAPLASFGLPLPSTNPSTPAISGGNHPLTISTSTTTSLATLRGRGTNKPTSNTHPIPPPNMGPKSQPTNGDPKKQKKGNTMPALVRAFAALSLSDNGQNQAHKQRRCKSQCKAMRNLVAMFSKLSLV